ncbi:hypothetical protein MAR_020724 [Mya arenaria]|uniref:Uncharacterized protein n=1 Tax=Mya arenaria TaxID=6604 RepID=A0ABY7E661_MYAAR|nr:hypothetical protein MAR_020724 [Mya arenaria]
MRGTAKASQRKGGTITICGRLINKRKSDKDKSKIESARGGAAARHRAKVLIRMHYPMGKTRKKQDLLISKRN